MRQFIVKLPVSATELAKLTITAPSWFEAMSMAMLRFPSIAPRAISVRPLQAAKGGAA